MSWIEAANPVQPNAEREDFEKMVPKDKRKATDDIYWKVLEEADRMDITPERLITYIGERYARYELVKTHVYSV